MALSADRTTASIEGTLYTFPVAASVTCYGGGLAVLDTAGNVKPGVTGTGLIAVGRFRDYVDNSTGTAGDVSADVEPGIFRWDNSTATDLISAAEIGDLCYVVNDHTVAKTSATNTRSAAGRVVGVDSFGVFVFSNIAVA